MREEANVPPAPALATNKPYSVEHGSIEGELVAWALYNYPLYQDDVSKVYYYLD